MAASTPHIDYPLKLYHSEVVPLNVIKLKQHLIEQLSYSQTEASTLVDEITSLVREDDKSVLRTAAVEREALHLVNVMLQSVHPIQRLRFIQTQACGADGLCFIARYHPDTLRQILQSVSTDDERLQLLQMKDITHWTALHYAAFTSATETVQVISESVSEEICYTLLSMEDSNKWTPLHIACMWGKSEVLEMMMRLMSVEMRYKLLQLPAMYVGHTPLHWSARYGTTQHIGVIAESVSL